MNSSNFNDLKQNINLISYAASLGYSIDKEKTTRHSAVLKNAKNDKIVVSKKNGIWVYFSVGDDGDNGTIIDFVKNRTSLELGEIGKSLEGFNPDNISLNNEVSINEQRYNPKRIEKVFNNCKTISSHQYLDGRGIRTDIIASNRFKDTIYTDAYNNVAFPHFKKKKICGLELKSNDLSLMVRGSEKTLWRSNFSKSDEALIIAEAPIDALSYQALFSLEKAFFVATSGGVSNGQIELIEHTLNASPNIKKITVISDKDEGGDRLFNKIEKHLSPATQLEQLKRHSPKAQGDDWNNELMQQLKLK